MDTGESAERAVVVDLARLAGAAAARKWLVLAMLFTGAAAGAAWHALAERRYAAHIAFVKSQAEDHAAGLMGMGSLGLLGVAGQSQEPPLLRYIERYLKTRDFLREFDSLYYFGAPLRAHLSEPGEALDSIGFYEALGARLKVDKEDGLIIIKALDRDPAFTVFLADRVYEMFRLDYEQARLQMIEENLNFANDLVARKRAELSQATVVLRDFLEANRGLGSPSLEQRRGELALKVKLAEEKYILAEKEKSTLEIKHEKKDQSLAVIERPFIPLRPEYPRRMVTLVLPILGSLLLALLLVGVLDRRRWIRVSAG